MCEGVRCGLLAKLYIDIDKYSKLNVYVRRRSLWFACKVVY